MLNSYCITSIGGRSYNEDSYTEFGSGAVRGFAVCDGLGGCGFGEIASKTVCRFLREEFDGEGSEVSDDDSTTGTGFDVEARLSDALIKAEQALKELQKNNNAPRAYKTTLAAVAVCGDTAYIAHCGDSRVYHFADGKYAWRTRDHSLAQMFVLAGDIEENEIRTCEDRSVLLHAMGSATEDFLFEMNVRTLSGLKSDAFIICSDGFWEFVTGEDMQAELSALSERGKLSPEEWLGALEARLSGLENNDNYTAAALIITKEDEQIDSSL